MEEGDSVTIKSPTYDDLEGDQLLNAVHAMVFSEPEKPKEGVLDPVFHAVEKAIDVVSQFDPSLVKANLDELALQAFYAAVRTGKAFAASPTKALQEASLSLSRRASEIVNAVGSSPAVQSLGSKAAQASQRAYELAASKLHTRKIEADYRRLDSQKDRGIGSSDAGEFVLVTDTRAPSKDTAPPSPPLKPVPRGVSSQPTHFLKPLPLSPTGSLSGSEASSLSGLDSLDGSADFQDHVAALMDGELVVNGASGDIDALEDAAPVDGDI